MAAAAELMTRDQYTRLKTWFDENSKPWPEEILALFGLLFGLFDALVSVKTKHVHLLARLREAMRLSPKSESARQLLAKR